MSANSSSIKKSIRSQLPVKHILQEYLGGNYQEEFDESEDESEEQEKGDVVEKEKATVEKQEQEKDVAPRADVEEKEEATVED